MSDELENKNGKVKVMYVRSDDDSDKRTQNPRAGKGGGRLSALRAEGGRHPVCDDRKGPNSERGRKRGRDRDVERDRRREDLL